MTENREKGISRPPFANRGVSPSIEEGSQLPILDAFCSTVYAHHELVADTIEDALEASGTRVERSVGGRKRQYTGSLVLSDLSGFPLVSIRHGGFNPHPWVDCVGRGAPVVADALRSSPLELSLTRIDSAYDVSSPTAFSELLSVARRYRKERNISLTFEGGDLDDPYIGSTIYLGSRKAGSPFFVRIYQKGLQIAEQMGLVGDDIPDELRNWVRIEAEHKPQKKPAKMAALRLDTSGVWGTSLWGQQFASEVLSLDVERIKATVTRDPNYRRALYFMAMQYRRALELLLKEHNGDEAAAFRDLMEMAQLVELQAA